MPTPRSMPDSKARSTAPVTTRALRALLMAASLSALTGLQGAMASDADVILHTSQGPIAIELYEERAPVSVENFLAYVADGHYEGTLFHRVIDGFMIQGGGFDADFQQKPTREPITNEADNGLANERGTLAMARTGEPHSATAQFFINVADNDFLDHRGPQSGQTWGYAVFGRVVEGMDVVDTIEDMPTTSRGPFQDVPAEPVLIERVERL